MDRRDFLKTSAGALAAFSLVGCSGEKPPVEAGPEPEPEDGATEVKDDPGAIAEDLVRFPRGVQAGGMTSTSALLWTYASAAEPLRLRVWRDSATPGNIKLVGEREVTPIDGFVKVTFEGLGPGWYRFGFFSPDGQRRSRIGHFRTAFAPGDLRPLRIAGLDCTNYDKRPFTALDMTAALQPDLIVHLGDVVYADGATTLAEYREMWRLNLEEPSYLNAWASSGFYACWDDHEFENNFNPEKINAAQYLAAKQAFFETLAVERGENDRLWRSYRWGATAEIFILDTRSERLPSTHGTETPIYISRAQMDWLKKALAESPCHFKILLNSVPFSRLFGLWDATKGGRWEGYQAQRQELLDWIIGQKIERVFSLSGDFHCSFIARAEPDGPGRRIFELLVGPTAPKSPNPIAILADSGDLPRDEIFPESQFLFGSGNRFATTEIVLDPLKDTFFVRYVRAADPNAGAVAFEGLVPVELSTPG